jgi:hypothetical protein
LAPVNIAENHWVLCVLYPDVRSWAIIDSAGEESRVTRSQFYIHMRLWLDTKITPEQPWSYSFPITRNNRHQFLEEDGANCGVYVCHYAESLALGRPLHEVVSERQNKEEISARRDDILLTIVESLPVAELKQL